MNEEHDAHPVSSLLKQHRKSLSYRIPEGLERDVRRDVSSERTPRRSFADRLSLGWFSLGSGAFATCAALIFAFQLGQFTARASKDQIDFDEVVSAHVRSLMAAHIYDVESTDQHTVKPWFEGKIDFAPTVKNFSSDQFPLLGGRLDYIESRPTAALVYRYNQHIINVLEQPLSSSESTQPVLISVRGYQVFTWAKDGMKYWAVSDLNAAELQRFVNLW